MHAAAARTAPSALLLLVPPPQPCLLLLLPLLLLLAASLMPLHVLPLPPPIAVLLFPSLRPATLATTGVRSQEFLPSPHPPLPLTPFPLIFDALHLCLSRDSYGTVATTPRLLVPLRLFSETWPHKQRPATAAAIVGGAGDVARAAAGAARGARPPAGPPLRTEVAEATAEATGADTVVHPPRGAGWIDTDERCARCATSHGYVWI